MCNGKCTCKPSEDFEVHRNGTHTYIKSITTALEIERKRSKSLEDALKAERITGIHYRALLLRTAKDIQNGVYSANQWKDENAKVIISHPTVGEQSPSVSPPHTLPYQDKAAPEGQMSAQSVSDYLGNY